MPSDMTTLGLKALADSLHKVHKDFMPVEKTRAESDFIDELAEIENAMDHLHQREDILVIEKSELDDLVSKANSATGYAKDGGEYVLKLTQGFPEFLEPSQEALLANLLACQTQADANKLIEGLTVKRARELRAYALDESGRLRMKRDKVQDIMALLANGIVGE